MKRIKVGVHDIYNTDFASYNEFLESLDQSLNPRSPDLMYKKFGTFNPTKDTVVFDAGCRDARHMCILAEKYESKFEGIDIVKTNIEDAEKEISKLNLQERVNARLGDLLELPYDDNSFDIIWCRDVLGHMSDLKKAFESFYRVLKPNGKVIIFIVTATDLLTPEEADDICDPLATFKETIYPAYFEESFTSAGFTCIEKDVVGSEWREFSEEAGNGISSKQLLRIAKLKRNEEKYIEMYGENTYAVELANCHYGVYQMLGKLAPVIYTLKK